jgi:uncharacterized membrane protein
MGCGVERAVSGAAYWRLLLIGPGTLVVPLDSASNVTFPPITTHWCSELCTIQ